jgi:hypothetical protein
MIQFKIAKNLRSKCLKLKSEGPFSNCTPTQGVIIHLPLKKSCERHMVKDTWQPIRQVC